MGPIAVIKPLPAPCLDLGGDDFFYWLPTGITSPFLKGQSSFLSDFQLGAPFLTTLWDDEDVLSFSSFLHVTVDALTNALCLVASIFAKGK